MEWVIMLGFAYKERSECKVCDGEGKYEIDYATTYFHS